MRSCPKAQELEIVGVEAGKAFFKITVFGNNFSIYTPYIERPTSIQKNPNAIVRISKLIERIEAWAYEYEQKNKYECAGGTVVPKINIGAIRGGVPYKITRTVQQCAIYLDVRITPKREPLDVREQLRQIMRDAALDGEVDLYAYRPGFEVDEAKGAPLRSCLMLRAHRAIVGGEPKPAPVATSSMWRDLNCFNEMRIPSYTYGPGLIVGGGIFRMPIKNMIMGTQLYMDTERSIYAIRIGHRQFRVAADYLDNVRGEARGAPPRAGRLKSPVPQAHRSPNTPLSEGSLSPFGTLGFIEISVGGWKRHEYAYHDMIQTLE